MNKISAQNIKNDNNCINIIDFIIIILLFFFGLSFFNKSNYYVLSIFLVSVFWFLKEKKYLNINKKIFINIEFVWAVCFFLSFLVLNYIINDSVIITRITIWGMMYLAGFMIMFKNSKSSKLIPTFMMAIALGFVIYALLTVFFTDSIVGKGRVYYAFWTGNIKNATQIAAWCIPMIGMIIYGFFENKKEVRILVLIGVVATLFINFKTGQRTAIIIFSIITIYTICKQLLEKSYVKAIKTLLILLLLSIIVFVLYKINLFGFQEYILQSNLYKRLFNSNLGDLLDDPRFKRQIYSITHFFDGFNGGYVIRSQVGQLHNLWLDLYDMVGILPFTFLILFTFQNLKNFFIIIKNKDTNDNLSNAIVGWYLVLLIQFCLEPILEYGDGKLFASYLFISGCVNSYILSNKINKKAMFNDSNTSK